MKRSQIYLRAAETLGECCGDDNSPFICDALSHFEGGDTAKSRFAALFEPEFYEGKYGWWDEPPIRKELITRSSRRAQNYRRFALCLAAAIAESDGD